MASVTAEHYLLPAGEDEVGAAAAAAARLADPLGRRQRRPLAELTPALVRQRLQQKYGLGAVQTAWENGRLPAPRSDGRSTGRAAQQTRALALLCLFCCLLFVVCCLLSVFKCVLGMVMFCRCNLYVGDSDASSLYAVTCCCVRSFCDVIL